MIRRIGVSLASMLVLTVTAGCQSTSDAPVTLDADSYEYKGAADPLLSVSASERAGALGDRFDLIQARQ